MQYLSSDYLGTEVMVEYLDERTVCLSDWMVDYIIEHTDSTGEPVTVKINQTHYKAYSSEVLSRRVIGFPFDFLSDSELDSRQAAYMWIPIGQREVNRYLW